MTKLLDTDLAALVTAQILAGHKAGGVISEDAIANAAATAVSIIKAAKAAVEDARSEEKPLGTYKTATTQSYEARGRKTER
jgi:hypothetical protein